MYDAQTQYIYRDIKEYSCTVLFQSNMEKESKKKNAHSKLLFLNIKKNP